MIYRYVVTKSSLKGEVKIPSSKSETLRAILFGSLANGKSVVNNYLDSNDTKSMIDACKLFGAEIKTHAHHLEIAGFAGEINHCDDVINAGNSGLVLRFCSCIAALCKQPVVITGDHSIKHQRPMAQVINGLSQLKVSAISTKGDGFAPLIIQGPISPGKVTISGEDSQPVSGLLIASAFAEGETEICVENPGEKPWVGMTLSWFERLNIPYQNENFTRYRMFGGAHYEGFNYSVPGDLSSAAFPIAAALVTNSEIKITNIDMNSCQGDKELIYVFQTMGACIEVDKENKILYVKRNKGLSGITVDINNFIDSVTILAVVACFAEGDTHIQNASIAKTKECNRLNAITTELKKMNADIEETEDGLRVRKSNLKGAEVYSHKDHRMCMSLAVAGLGAEGETIISDSACVQKTYPTFLQDFLALNATISEG